MSDINTKYLGQPLDHDLKAFHDVESVDNIGLILYIRNGELAVDTYENLFTIEALE